MTQVNGSPTVIPSGVATLVPRENRMLGPNEWKVVWRNAEPRRMRIVDRLYSKPEWAEHEWEPFYDALNEDTACRAVLRTFVAEGWEPEEVDDEMGQAIGSWAANPQRIMRQSGKNQLIACYHSIRAHLVDGGRLRDVPINVVTVVAEHMGLSRWRHWIQSEYEQYGEFPKAYKDVIEDCWRAEGSDDTRRVERSPHLERKDEVKS